MNKICLYFRMLYRDIMKSMFSIRGFLIIITLVYMNFQVIHPVVEWAQKYNAAPEPAALPFVFYDAQFLLLFGILVIFLFSEVPFINRHTTYLLLRLGKVRWLTLQFIRMGIMSFLYMLVETLISMLCCGGLFTFHDDWGSVWTTLSVMPPKDLSIYVPRNTLLQFTPAEAVCRVFLMGVLVLLLMGCLMMCCSLLVSNTFAIICAGIISVFPYVCYNVSLFTPRIFYFSPMSWIGIIEHSRMYIYGGPDSHDMLKITLLLIILCIILIRFTIKRTDLKEWKGESV